MRVLPCALIVLAACGDAEGPIIAITAPTLGAYVPGGSLAIAWDASPAFDAAHLAVRLVPRDGGAGFPLILGEMRAPTTTAPTADGFTWAGEDALGGAVRPGFYGLAVADTRRGDSTYDGGDTSIIAVVGAVPTAPAISTALTLTPAAPVTLHVDVSTIAPLSVTLVADPSTADGDELPITTMEIPGEIRTVDHDFAWDGTLAAGGKIATGDYTIDALIDDGTTTWRVGGGIVHVVP